LSLGDPAGACSSAEFLSFRGIFHPILFIPASRNFMSATSAFRSDHSSCCAPLEQLEGLLPVRDLTEAVLQGEQAERYLWTPGIRDRCEVMARRMFRTHAGNVLLTGRSGVGKTALVWQFAEWVTTQQVGTLAQARLLWLDCQNVGPEDSRACLESIFSLVSRLEFPVILCLDGMASLLRRPNGGNNKPLLRALLRRPQLRVIGILSDTDYAEQIGWDAGMREDFSRVEVEEPGEEEALQMTRFRAAFLQEQHQLQIAEEVIAQTVSLASTFVLGLPHPRKSIQLLQQACEDATYRGLQGDFQTEIQLDDVISAIAEKTGIPVETISGSGSRVDFQSALTDAVVGQEAAVQQVSRELRLIKSGLNEPGKPASVMLFAGMTGVGKTELAKRIAELYSSSGRVQVYTMANFTEPHSVSGIIGVPPGYVGYEEGGRLINELNADPYSVFLLDEAEKAHPNVWKPFLNLFDEGWIVDQRGMKAYADRAIFILTTNAGDRNIAQMTQSGKAPEEIAEHVKQALSKVRHERSSQPVFPPAFLARIGRVIVFQPLEEQAMIGIAERACRKLQRQWEQKRQTPLTFTRKQIEAIGRKGHELNQHAHGREGGRIIRKLVAEELERMLPVALRD